MLQDSDQRVDIVYLWVDGSDPVWRRKRQRAAARIVASQPDAMARYGNVEGRFRDNDELRYSLRSLSRFFPGHGHIYVVTDGQTPTWLTPSSRLTLVDHRTLLPTHKLPTFDSGNIESYIHRIPNLSERYFYLNDDIFFGAPVRLGDWFYKGGTYVCWSDDRLVTREPLRADATALENACRLSHQLLEVVQAANPVLDRLADGANAYKPVFRTFAHSPRPMLKSRMTTLEGLFPKLFDDVRSTLFRTWDKPPIVSDFVMRWALAHGQARLRKQSHLYLSTDDGFGLTSRLEGQLNALVAAVGRLDFFCINDTTDDARAHDPRLGLVRAALEKIFPQPSRFERPAPPAMRVSTELEVAAAV